MSALAGVPTRQDLAVTGSVNQLAVESGVSDDARLLLAQADLVYPFLDDHVVTDRFLTFSLKLLGQCIGFHARTFRHFDKRLGGTHEHPHD